jgi:hypothetical protein
MAIGLITGPRLLGLGGPGARVECADPSPNKRELSVDQAGFEPTEPLREGA